MTVISNKLKIVTKCGQDIKEVLFGIDPSTNLGYRFTDFSDIAFHISLTAISNPYFEKKLDVQHEKPFGLILELSEDELLNASVVDTMKLQNPPPRFHFYINGIKDGRRVVLFTGEIHRKSY